MKHEGKIEECEECSDIEIYKDEKDLQYYISQDFDCICLTPVMIEELLDILVGKDGSWNF